MAGRGSIAILGTGLDPYWPGCESPSSCAMVETIFTNHKGQTFQPVSPFFPFPPQHTAHSSSLTSRNSYPPPQKATNAIPFSLTKQLPPHSAPFPGGSRGKQSYRKPPRLPHRFLPAREVLDTPYPRLPRNRSRKGRRCTTNSNPRFTLTLLFCNFFPGFGYSIRRRRTNRQGRTFISVSLRDMT